MIMFWARYNVLWWAIFGQILIAGLLVRTGIAHFNREELLGRELDTLNLRWSWQIFWGAIVGDAKSLSTWIRREIVKTTQRMWLPLLLVFAAFVGGALVGVQQAQIFVLPPDLLDISNLQQGFVQEIDGFETLRFFSLESVPLVWVHNLRVIILATILGIFTFGVMGVIVLMLPFILIGYFTVAAARAGIQPGLFLTAFVLPHGILEIPAIALAGAAILRLGATLSTPAENRTIGEALLISLADWVKVLMIFVLPMLFGAAILEVFITPEVALRMLGN